MRRLVLALPILGLVFATGAQAAAVYDNTVPVSGDVDDLHSPGPQLGDSFSVSSTFAFNQLDLVLAAALNTDTGGPLQDGKSFSVDLYSGGSASDFGTFQINLGIILDDDLSVTPGVTPLTFPDIDLGAGRYWIVLTDIDGSTAGWSYSSDISGPGVMNEFFYAGGAFLDNSNSPHQMAVLGRFLPGSSVPEPLTLSLLGAGLIALVALRRSKAR